MAIVPGSGGGDHVDLDFEYKQVRCNARDLAKTIQEIMQEMADADGTKEAAEVVMDTLKVFRLSDNDDFLLVYSDYSQQDDNAGE